MVPPRSRTGAYATASRISLYQAQVYTFQRSSIRLEALPALMRGYPELKHNMLGVLINGRDLNQPDPPFGATVLHR